MAGGGMILLGVIVVLLTLLMPFIRSYRRRRWNQLLARQLRQSLQSITQGLRTGMSFLQALEAAAREEEEPLAGEWRKVVQAVRLGTPLGQALADLGQR